MAPNKRISDGYDTFPRPDAVVDPIRKERHGVVLLPEGNLTLPGVADMIDLHVERQSLRLPFIDKI